MNFNSSGFFEEKGVEKVYSARKEKQSPFIKGLFGENSFMKEFAGMTWRTVLTISMLFILLAILSCASKPDRPEEQVRALLKQAEVAAKEKKLSVFKKLISDDYTDDAGRDKQILVGLLKYHFLGNRSIHLFTQVKEIGFPRSGVGVITLFVAMAGTPIRVKNKRDILRLRADLHRFEITLAHEDGHWKAVRAEWRSALPREFL